MVILFARLTLDKETGLERTVLIVLSTEEGYIVSTTRNGHTMSKSEPNLASALNVAGRIIERLGD
jgi:hypothetical protein